MADENMWLSKSSFVNYLQCPYKFKRIYIDGYVLPTNKFFEWGTKIHKAVEDFFNGCRERQAFEIPKLSRNELRYLNSFFKFQEVRFKFLEKKDSLETFFPVLSEEKVECPHEKIKGIIDLVFKRTSGDYEIVEIKTGRPTLLKKKEIFKELRFYKYLLEASGKIPRVKYLTVNFVRENDFYTRTFNYKDSIFPKYLSWVRKQIGKENFRPKYNQYCRFCEFRHECGFGNKKIIV